MSSFKSHQLNSVPHEALKEHPYSTEIITKIGKLFINKSGSELASV